MPTTHKASIKSGKVVTFRITTIDDAFVAR